MNIKNLDQDEVAKFDELATRWWDKDGEFKPLHQINPLRVGFINDRTPLQGKKILENSGLDIIAAADLEEAAEKIVKVVEG